MVPIFDAKELEGAMGHLNFLLQLRSRVSRIGGTARRAAILFNSLQRITQQVAFQEIFKALFCDEYRVVRGHRRNASEGDAALEFLSKNT